MVSRVYLLQPGHAQIDRKPRQAVQGAHQNARRGESDVEHQGDDLASLFQIDISKGLRSDLVSVVELSDGTSEPLLTFAMFDQSDRLCKLENHIQECLESIETN